MAIFFLHFIEPILRALGLISPETDVGLHLVETDTYDIA